MSENPILIPQAFASNGSKNTIQNTRQPGQDPEDATWSDGFPNVTMQPMESGGLPPKGMDFNGIFHALSASIVHLQKGGFFHFDPNHANAIGGYPAGAILIADDNSRLFISTTDKNKTDPNQNPTGWGILAGEGVNATTATKLQTPRYINGVLFDGSSDINATPAGAVQFFAMQSAPTGWLKANGAEVSRSTYANLFAAIGTYYGAGNGSTTFNLPDLRGEFLRAHDDGRGVDAGRQLGTWQIGTPISHDDPVSAEVFDVVSMDYSARKFGDKWTGELPTAFYSAPYGHQSPAYSNTFFTMTRPRNIALLACIKI